MRLALYSSGRAAQTPNLVALQDEDLSFVPTVLVCPARADADLTPIRVRVSWSGRNFVICTELVRPIRRTALRPMGFLDEEVSRALMAKFHDLLAQ